MTVGAPFDFAAYRGDSMHDRAGVVASKPTRPTTSAREEWQRGFNEMFGRVEPFPVGGGERRSPWCHPIRSVRSHGGATIPGDSLIAPGLGNGLGLDG